MILFAFLFQLGFGLLFSCDVRALFVTTMLFLLVVGVGYVEVSWLWGDKIERALMVYCSFKV